jgi:hypothetical protein
MKILEADFASATPSHYRGVGHSPTERQDFNLVTVIILFAFAFDSLDLKEHIKGGVNWARKNDGHEQGKK